MAEEENISEPTTPILDENEQGEEGLLTPKSDLNNDAGETDQHSGSKETTDEEETDSIDPTAPTAFDESMTFDESMISEEEPKPEEGNADNLNELALPDIPEYASRKNIPSRHKLLQNALLTQELIKLFDIICQNITLREKNYFSITDFLVSSNFSSVQKENLQHNFLKLVDLLTEKTVDLVKVEESEGNSRAVSISLKEPKNFNLVIFHKFNDFIFKSYNERNPLRKPILYQMDHLAESIKLPKEKLLPFCLYVPLKEINNENLNKLVSEQKESSGKLALVINLQNEQFGEAIFPLQLAKDLLTYLCKQMSEYLNNISSEKISALIIRKLQESKIEYANIKKYLIKPDPHHAEFSAFIRIFYSVISQVYSKNINYSNKKIKETESFLVISLIARQLVLNAKLSGPTKKARAENITADMIIRELFNQTKEVNHEVVRIPVTLDALMKRPFKVNDKPIHPNRDQLINAFQKLNSDVHTIKEILILRHNATNYYIHRTCIVSLFLNLLAVEKPKIRSAIEEEIQINRRRLLKEKNSFEEFIDQQINTVLKLAHECLNRCLMTTKPIAYQDNQSLYWMSRLFPAKDELIRFQLQNSELDFDQETKKSIFKNLIKTLTYSNKNFKTISEILGVPYENYAHLARFSLLGFLSRLLEKLIGVTVFKKMSTSPNSLFSSTKKNNSDSGGLSGLSQSDDKYSTHRHSSDNSYTDSRKKVRSDSKKLVKQLEDKLPLLKDPDRLKQKIAEEMNSWNLKLGESRKQNQQVIDGIINGCIVRLDNQELVGEEFDKIYEVIVRNNPPIRKIKNQKALKNYMMYKIVYNKYKRLSKQYQ